MRAIRLKIPQAYQNLAGLGIAKNLQNCGILSPTKKVGFYFSVHPEIPTHAALKEAFRNNVRCYLPAIQGHLPAIQGHRAMEFRPFGTQTPLVRNRFGIPEPPASAPPVKLHVLDTILLPLVAFDRSGNRIGMGAGYYDRALATLNKEKRRPLLVGLGYRAQEVSRIETDEWDLKMDLIVTEKQVLATHQPWRPGLKNKKTQRR